MVSSPNISKKHADGELSVYSHTLYPRYVETEYHCDLFGRLKIEVEAKMPENQTNQQTI